MGELDPMRLQCASCGCQVVVSRQERELMVKEGRIAFCVTCTSTLELLDQQAQTGKGFMLP